MLNQERFIDRCIVAHGNKYDYTKTAFKKATEKVIITCPIHGDFEMVARQHYRGQGCPKCGREAAGRKRLDNTDSFITKAVEIHGKKYDYSKVVYTRSNEKVEIVCPKHGSFWQKPGCHINSGHGCPECKREHLSEHNRFSFADFLEKAVGRYGLLYDYSKVEYVDFSTPVKIICQKHGEFLQAPKNHLNGIGCPKCGKESSAKNRRMSKETFIKKCVKVHGVGKYDYSDTDISKGVYSQINVRCLKHGIFTQKMYYHLAGNGCQKCASELTHSKSELDLLKQIKLLCSGDSSIIEGDRGLLSGNHEIDIYLPRKKLAFEYDGLFWHSEAKGKDNKYHLRKTEGCLEKGVQLIHIFEDEWENKREICLSRIKNLLGLCECRVFSRKCEIRKVSSKDAGDFLLKNHIQGKTQSPIAYGLYYNGELISLMTFGKRRKNLGATSKEGDYELLRFCNKLGYSIPGAASRLFTHFIREYNPYNVISYADRRWSNGNLYEKIGFKLDHISKPNYFYVINGKRQNRFSFRKDVLVKEYGCPPDMTERDFCKSKGWWRIYDCGCLVYRWKRPID